jgi:hypothetical protein
MFRLQGVKNDMINDIIDAALIAACTAAVETCHAPPDSRFATIAEHLTIEQIEEDIARGKTRREGYQTPELEAEIEANLASQKAPRRRTQTLPRHSARPCRSRQSVWRVHSDQPLGETDAVHRGDKTGLFRREWARAPLLRPAGQGGAIPWPGVSPPDTLQSRAAMPSPLDGNPHTPRPIRCAISSTQNRLPVLQTIAGRRMSAQPPLTRLPPASQ